MDKRNVQELIVKTMENIRKKLRDGLTTEDLAVWFGTKKKPKGSKQPKGPWVNICRKEDGKHPPCGRDKATGKGYPKCRAVGVAAKMTDEQKRAACAQKRRAEKKEPKVGKGNKPTMASYKPRKESMKKTITLKESELISLIERMIKESQYKKLLKEVVEIPSWLEGKLKDVHTKAGQGSIFAKPLDYVLKQAQDALDKSSDLDKIANGAGTLTIKSPGIGYNLVLPIEKAKQLPNAKISETEKIEGPNKIKVPLVTTSAAPDQFKTDELTIIVRPKKDEAGTIIPNEYIVLSVFPGDSTIPKASEWRGKYAVIIPNNK